MLMLSKFQHSTTWYHITGGKGPQQTATKTKQQELHVQYEGLLAWTTKLNVYRHILT